jgi:cysteine desulfurase
MAIYLDHAASTPLLPEVLAAYAEALRTVGNPSSIHGHGQRAKQALEESRERLAAVLGCEPVEVVFTSGGTEAINAAIKGLYWAARTADPERSAILIPGGEHHATVDTVDWLVGSEGARRIDVRLDPDGRVPPGRMAEALDNHGRAVALASMLWSNNEVGTIQPVAEIAALADGHGISMPSQLWGTSAWISRRRARPP